MSIDPLDSNLSDLSVTEFLNTLGAGTPTPGGGSAAALSGAAAAALIGMVAKISLARGTAIAPDAAARLVEIEQRAAVLQILLTGLIDLDAAAYGSVLAAYRLPKETPEEKADRFAAIQSGFVQAAATPLETATACAELLALAGDVAEIGISSAASDAAVAALLAHAGLRGGALNVAVNLDSIKDGEFVNRTDAALAAILQSGATDLDNALAHLNRGD